MSDDFDSLFADEEEIKPTKPLLEPWKIMIVDDEEMIHEVTKLALDDFSYDGRELDMTSCYSAKEAIEFYDKNQDVALILLDVIMENDHAGLDVVKHIREKIGNYFTRIILRTGQPGQSPEKQIIVEYDINDYKSKTELTSQKLFTVMVSSLRAYKDILTIEENRKNIERSRLGLEKIIDATVSIFKINSTEKFLSGIMIQIVSILNALDGNEKAQISCLFAGRNLSGHEQDYSILIGEGDFENHSGKPLKSLSEDEFNFINNIKSEESPNFTNGKICLCFETKNHELLFYLKGHNSIDSTTTNMISLFCNNIAVVFDNIELHDNLRSLNNAYKRFAPADSMKFLNKKSILEVELGEGTEKNVSILFLDIRSFTSITEKMSPQQCLNFLNSYLEYIGPIIEKHHGVINKYLGDGLMAIFDQESKSSEDAVLCAKEIILKTEQFSFPNPLLENQEIKIKVGIGINFGPVILGTMGSPNRLEFTVLGDTVNTASRLQDLTKTFGISIVVTESVADEIGSKFDKRSVGATHLRGRRAISSVWEIITESEQSIKDLKISSSEQFSKAIEFYEAKEFQNAKQLLNEILEMNPKDSVAEFYLAKIGKN